MPAAERKRLPVYTRINLVAWKDIFPSALLNAQFLHNINCTMPPEILPARLPATYQQWNTSTSRTVTKKSISDPAIKAACTLRKVIIGQEDSYFKVATAALLI